MEKRVGESKFYKKKKISTSHSVEKIFFFVIKKNENPPELNKIRFFPRKKLFCDVTAVMIDFDSIAEDVLGNLFWKGFIIVRYLFNSKIWHTYNSGWLAIYIYDGLILWYVNGQQPSLWRWRTFVTLNLNWTKIINNTFQNSKMLSGVLGTSLVTSTSCIRKKPEIPIHYLFRLFSTWRR